MHRGLQSKDLHQVRTKARRTVPTQVLVGNERSYEKDSKASSLAA